MSFILHILAASWNVFVEAAPYFLLGLVISALLHAWVRPSHIAKYLGTSSLRSIGLAALSGIPLPLCSCGVVPTAIGLRKQGASKAATVAFLVSTPETGVDSIMVTYGLMGPVMAIIRPLSALVTAMVAGLAVHWGDPSAHARSLPQAAPTQVMGLRAGAAYAFGKLLADMTPWYLFGMLVGGVLEIYLPQEFVTTYLGGGVWSLLAMLAIGIPMYICASASTPIAAMLLMKGMSPGAALVFLLAGPATNLSVIPMLTKFLGARAVALYLGAIAGTTFAIGLLVDTFALSIFPNFDASLHHHGDHANWLSIACSVALLLLMARSVWRTRRHAPAHSN